MLVSCDGKREKTSWIYLTIKFLGCEKTRRLNLVISYSESSVQRNPLGKFFILNIIMLFTIVLNILHN